MCMSPGRSPGAQVGRSPGPPTTTATSMEVPPTTTDLGLAGVMGTAIDPGRHDGRRRLRPLGACSPPSCSGSPAAGLHSWDCCRCDLGTAPAGVPQLPRLLHRLGLRPLGLVPDATDPVAARSSPGRRAFEVTSRKSPGRHGRQSERRPLGGGGLDERPRPPDAEERIPRLGGLTRCQGRLPGAGGTVTTRDGRAYRGRLSLGAWPRPCGPRSPVGRRRTRRRRRTPNGPGVGLVGPAS